MGSAGVLADGATSRRECPNTLSARSRRTSPLPFPVDGKRTDCDHRNCRNEREYDYRRKRVEETRGLGSNLNLDRRGRRVSRAVDDRNNYCMGPVGEAIELV